MKKTIVMMLIAIFAVSMLLMGVGCKKEAAPAEEVAEEAAPAEEVAEEAPAEEEAEAEAEEPFPSTISGEVTFMSYWTGGVEAEALDMIAKKFMEDYPNIELTIIPKPGDEIYTVIQTNLASSDPVDSFMFWPDAALKPFVDQGLVAPLTDIYEAMNYDEIAPGVYNWARFPGHGDTPYALPINKLVFATFYNIHKFEEAGIEKVPETWEEFLDVCQTLQDAGIVPTARSAGTIGLPHWSWLDRFGTRTMDDYGSFLQSVKDLSIDWTDPRFTKACSYWDEMLPYWHPDSTSLTYGDIYMMLARGDIAMQTLGSWIIGSYETEMGMVPFEDYDMFTFPIIDPDIPIQETGNCNSAQLSMAGKDNIAAQAWIAYWMRPETQEMYCNYTSNAPAIEGIKIDSPMISKISSVFAGRKLCYQFQLGAGLHDLVVAEVEKRSYGLITQEKLAENLNNIYAEWREKEE
ncbi:MAG: extracellular solute-binding protein [Actinobacteria bacterium]|nr:extracellular solute-binding protein [Actinomycetota bacterium]